MPPDAKPPQRAREQVAPASAGTVGRKAGRRTGMEGAPERRGRARRPARPRMPRGRLWPFLIALFVVNYWIPSTIPDKPTRAHIAYSPQFLREVKASNVSQVTITDQKIEGEFKHPVTVGKKTFTRFSTNQPALPDRQHAALAAEEKEVEINAEPPDYGPRPARAAPARLRADAADPRHHHLRDAAARPPAAARWARFGRSKAKRYEGTERVTFEDVAGIEEAEQELVEVVDFLKNPVEVQRARGARSRAASCSRARRARARRCSRARSRARRACRSSRPARASSSR